MKIWPAVPSDVGFFLDVARQSYGQFDEETCARETLALIARSAAPNPDILAYRTDRAACIIGRLVSFWAPQDAEWHVMFLASMPGSGWATYKLLRFMIASAEREGGASLHFGSSTGVDFTPFAKRLGAQQEPPSFRVGLRRGQEGHQAAS